MATKRRRADTPPVTAPGRPLPVSAAVLVARGVALVVLALVAVLVACVAWILVKSALRVDPVVGRERVWLQYGHHRQPFAHVPLPAGKYVVPGSAYDLALEATVPVNDNNLRLGNFMVGLSLIAPEGVPVLNASRPAILDPSMAIISRPKRRSSLLKSLVSLPFSLISSLFDGNGNCFSPQNQISTQLQIPLLENVALASTSAPERAGRSRSRWASLRRTQDLGGPVSSVYVQIGRQDAHPSMLSLYDDSEDDDEDEGEDYGGLEVGAAARRRCRGQRRRRYAPALPARSHQARELHVYEAWLRIEVKPSGLRAVVYRHPWIAFLIFLPTFLTFEAIAALAVYLYWVATSGTGPSTATTSEAQDLEEEEEEDRKPFQSGLISPSSGSELPASPATPSDYDRISDSELGPLAAEEAEEEEARRARERQRREAERLRLRLGREGVGMSAVSLEAGGARPAGAGEEVVEPEVEEMPGGVSDFEGGLLEEEEAEWIKGEEDDDDEPENASAVAASATTRRTTSTFGPSVAGTSATGFTASTSQAASALRSRGGGSTVPTEE